MNINITNIMNINITIQIIDKEQALFADFGIQTSDLQLILDI